MNPDIVENVITLPLLIKRAAFVYELYRGSLQQVDKYHIGFIGNRVVIWHSQGGGFVVSIHVVHKTLQREQSQITHGEILELLNKL